jgi:hypothetical protein
VECHHSRPCGWSDEEAPCAKPYHEFDDMIEPLGALLRMFLITHPHCGESDASKILRSDAAREIFLQGLRRSFESVWGR